MATPLESSEMRGVLAPGRRSAYALAGDATLTVQSSRTGERFTFKIEASKPEAGRAGVHFVSVLTGSNNEWSYTYLGTIFADGKFRVTKRSPIAADAPSAIAFAWLARNFEDPRVEVWHEGVCGRCGRKLTVPESIDSGIGPTCAGKLALAGAA